MANAILFESESGTMNAGRRDNSTLHPWRVLFVSVLLSIPCAGLARGADDGERFFEANVRPLLIKHCLECHSGEKPKGSFSLASRNAWQRGGDSGPAIVVGKPEESRLVHAIRFDDDISGMPPKGKLPNSAIKTLEEWILRGAPDPRQSGEGTVERLDARSHWSFQPIARPKLAPIDDNWSRTSLDRFVAVKHRAAGISPVADADRYTWLRRVTFDLTGLPPSPADIEAFLKDNAIGHHERVVDRLIASPAFGEKWGRHWLDMSCYADTIGSASMPMRHAWRYRDYVIESLNADRPMDEFVREQVAGDLLPADSPSKRRRNLIATGFLAIGPWQLAEQDKAQLRMDVVDHQITRIGTMFLGMTLDCARCHDHKFDPVQQRDYYAMAGLFANLDVLDGIWRSNVSAVLTVPLPELPHELDARKAATPGHDSAFAEAKSRWRNALQLLEKAEQDLANVPQSDPQFQAVVNKVEEARKAAGDAEGDWRFLEFHAPDVPRAHGVIRRATIRNVHINVRGSVHALGEEVPRGFVRAIGNVHPTIDADSSGRLELADWLFSADNPLTARVLVNRAWTRFFARGLVEPVDYFGVGAGDNQPEYQDLLDHLALELQRGWSLKSLVREIALSRTYGLAASEGGLAASVDPGNSPRRLDSEMIRDGMLLVAGRLQRNGGGPALPLDDRGALRPGDLVNPPTLGGGFEIPGRLRDARSIYQPVIRSYFHKTADVLELFDTPSPNHIVGHRDTTVVPTQSLFLLNSPIVRDRAAELAQRILNDATATSNEQRLELLWMTALGKPIEKSHREAAVAWLNSTEDHNKAWARLCHSLLASNEFLFRR